MKRTIVLLLVFLAGMGIFYLASADGHRTYQWLYSRVDSGMMPQDFGQKLTEADLKAILAYVKALK